MEPNRTGKCTEYKKGHYYLTHTEWEDGHCEIEVHKCVPEMIFHTCDTKELELAEDIFNQCSKLERQTEPLIVISR